MVWQEDTIAHTGDVLGSDAVTLSQNSTSPQRRTTIAEFECPRQYERISYVGRRDPTRFVPRYMQSATISDADASGALEEGERTIALNGNVQPVAGETNLAEQDYQAVEAVNTTQGTVIGADELTVDYAANEVVVAESAVADGDTVKVYPIITEGSLKWQGRDVLDQLEGRLYKWPFPVLRFHDFPQLKSGTEIRMHGSVEWKRHEKVQLTLDSPRTIVWTDADHPDAFVSKLEQDVEIQV